MARKGITPVIAIVLLLMMTVASAGLAWVWLQSMQTTTQEQLSEQVKQIGANPYQVIAVEPATGLVGDNIIMTIRNKDQATISGLGDPADIILKVNKRIVDSTAMAGECTTVDTIAYGETCQLDVSAEAPFPSLGETIELSILTKDGYEISYACTGQSAAGGNLYC